MYKPLQIKAPHTRNAKKPLNRLSQYKPSGVALGKAKFCIFCIFQRTYYYVYQIIALRT